jgi:hypothetical protein
MCPCLFTAADFGLLKFRHFVDLSIRGGCFYAGDKVRRDDGFVSRWLAFTFQRKIHSFINNNNFGVWPKYYS